MAKIQKSLDAYLETKRQFFPRFYFLSNEDLLEILGQQKDPEQVQKHIIKCFVGIKYLILMLPGVAGNRTVECTGLQAPDGETIPLVRNVRLPGRIMMNVIHTPLNEYSLFPSILLSIHHYIYLYIFL